ncbi:IclR family transcriptional regulator [Natrinema soli]|uniref:IclR family transcriptional regulator n=1 Tax=Natrinema soli TaxID=1930624 RepID=A0ABD5SJ58_9EURY|nr:IclR family transcriptional regulator [Natrinema soli]
MGRENAPTRIESVERSLEIVQIMTDLGTASATEIAERLNLAKSTTHYHLKTLEDMEFVVRKENGYRIGMKLLTMGHDLVNQMNLYRIGKPNVDRLAQETGELSILMVEEHGLGYYIYDSRGDKAVNFDTVGSEKYLHNNALGKAVLAHLPDERVDAIIDRHGLPKTTEQTITDRETLDAELTTAYTEGVTFDREEQLEGLCCVGAPIRNPQTTDDHSIQGAISVAVPASRAQGEYFTDELATAVTDTANLIELELADY